MITQAYNSMYINIYVIEPNSIKSQYFAILKKMFRLLEIVIKVFKKRKL